MDVSGVLRRYFVFVPKAATQPMPLVLVFHGGGGNARQMERYTRFDDAAEKHGFAVAYGESVGGNWNDGRDIAFIRAQRDKVDDVGFARAIVADVAREAKIDRGRVFATGISNGAIMSHRLAAEASDLVAGIAPVAGGMAPGVAEAFKPRFAVSIMIIQGDADPLVPIGGGSVVVGRGPPRGKVIATAEAVELYRRRNGNPDQPTRTTLDAKADDGTKVEITRYPDGPAGVKIELDLVKGGGHTWPGRPLYLPESTIGRASQEFPATEAISQFFLACPPREK